MTKILLTGGAGYIGSHTAVAMIEAGYDIVIADDFSNSNEAIIARLEELADTEIPYVKGDICEKEVCDRIWEEHPDIEGVIHFAGFKCVPESFREPLKYFRNNIDATLSLMEAMEKNNCRVLVFSSSATVYGEDNPVPFTEDMPTGTPTNPYGMTKLQIEQIIQAYGRANNGFSAVLLRYFNPIGAHSSGMIGDDPTGIPNNLMPYITQVAVGKRGFLTVYGTDYDTPDGTGIRDYIHVWDLAQGHVLALKYAMEHKGVEAINLGTGEGSSVLEVVYAFETANDVDIPLVFDERRPGDIAEMKAGVEKAKELLDWEADFGLHEMCRDSWRFQKNNPEGVK